MMIFVGVDWAEVHHEVLVQDEDGKRLYCSAPVIPGRYPTGHSAGR